jgi:type I restriction enzyme S subunit
MIANLRRYPEYKESGLPWLGGIPRHWQIGPGFAAFREKQVKNTGMQEKTVLSLSHGRIVVKPPEKLHGLVPASFETYQIVDPGDIIIRSTDLQNDWTSLRVGLVRSRGIITSAYLCFRTTSTLSPEYGYLILHAFDLMKVFYGMGSGLRQNLDFRDFKRMLIFVPPSEEQASIARFLDWANGRLERAIRAKLKVIALLNEQKQAIIHRAVTRGLAPSVPLKPSGIPWLGDIPKHWEVSRCGNLFYEVVDTGHPHALLLSIDRFKGVIPQSDTGRRTRASEDRSAYKRVRPGQLTYNLMNAFMGALGFSTYDGIVSPAYAVAQPRREIKPLYFHHLFRTTVYTGEFNRLSYGIMYERNRLYFERFKLVSVLIPPLAEQKEIVQGIHAQTAELEAAITRLEREIALLREYRTCLVADVVTGKLDVRAAAQRLPAEAEEPVAVAMTADLADENGSEAALSEDGP